MSTPQRSAATREPARDPHARDARASAEEPAAVESLYAHAKRVLRSRVSAAATAVLDAGIALLQRLRKAAGGAQDGGTDEDRPRSRKDLPGGRRDAAAPEAETPKPKRRRRAFLIYLCVLLAGGLGGGAFAYDLLEKLLDHQFAESRRLEAAITEHSQSAATAQKNLEETQAKRIEAEKKLEASPDEYTKSAAEKQKKLDETQKQLETLLAAERARTSPPASPASRGGAGSKTSPIKTGDCALSPGNLTALKDCISDFNR